MSIETEKRIVRILVCMMRTAGLEPTHVHDGEEHVPATSEQAVLEAVTSVDLSTITFSDGKKGYGVAVVLGNGIDCIADHTDIPGSTFNRVMDEHANWIENHF